MADEQDTKEAGGTVWDAPNQQVVRDDASPPWVEGEGGESGTPVSRDAHVVTDDERSVDVDELTKDELLDFAKQLGVKPANAAMTKDELRAGVDEKLGVV